MKNRDIIIVGIQPWDIEIGSNCKNIAQEFAKENRVLFVNPPLDRISSLRDRKAPRVKKRMDIVRKGYPELTEVGPNLWNLYPATIIESINKISSPRVFDYLNKINNRRLAQQIKLAIRELDFKDVIIFNDSDMFRSFYLKELIQPNRYVYYTRDNLIAVDYWKRQGIRLEPALMKKSDLVVSNSVYLAAQSAKHNPNSFYVGQGCDIDLFNPDDICSVPDDIKSIAKPIIGYIGALKTLRLDIDILWHIATSRPEWNVVLIGPEDEQFKQSALHQLPNVFFLGAKGSETLPSYLNRFDVALNPQIINPITIGNYPRKIDEYLAMGKPAVATKTDAMSVFADHCYLAESKEDYVILIEKALTEDCEEMREKRKAFAREHTWENNVNEIYKAIETSVSETK